METIKSALMADMGVRAADVLRDAMSPHLAAIARGADLNEERAGLDATLSELSGRPEVTEVRIWSLDGHVLYGSNSDVVGRSFPLSAPLATAIEGRIAVSEAARHPGEPESDESMEGLFEIYVPVRHPDSNAVAAVGEFHQDGASLARALADVRNEIWTMFGLVALSMLGGLYLMVGRGDAVIARQRATLGQTAADLAGLRRTNERLAARLHEVGSSHREDADERLRQAGADIHDGIGQFLTIALLRLDQALPDPAEGNETFRAVRHVLEDAMAEVREMTAGLSLPHLQGRPLSDAVELVVRRHRWRTATRAELVVADGLVEPNGPVRLAICRFVQEGLSNAFKHAGGRGQRVEIAWQEPDIVVVVSDAGPGLDAAPDGARLESELKTGRKPQGLAGLRDRVERLGGRFEVLGPLGRGTILRATFPVVS